MFGVIYNVANREGMVLPAYDNHFHMSPAGRNVEALKEFEAAGGTGITLVTLPYPEVPIRSEADWRESFSITHRFAERSREETSVEVNVAVGPYPIILLGLAESYGLERAAEIMEAGFDEAGRDVQEGRAVAIGEVGRPHFPVDPEVWDASNRVLEYGMGVARDVGCPVIIHCENEEGRTDASLAEIAGRAGLDPGRVMKHSSPPWVTPEETHGVMPSMPASKTNIKEAVRKGSRRFMLETDFCDDPLKPTSIMACTTVPTKVRWAVNSGTLTEDDVCRICRDIPESMYSRRKCQTSEIRGRRAAVRPC